MLYDITYILNVKKPNSQKQVNVVVTRGWVVRWEKWGNVGQRLQSSSYRTSKFWGSKGQHADYH